MCPAAYSERSLKLTASNLIVSSLTRNGEYCVLLGKSKQCFVKLIQSRKVNIKKIACHKNNTRNWYKHQLFQTLNNFFIMYYNYLIILLLTYFSHILLTFES